MLTLSFESGHHVVVVVQVYRCAGLLTGCRMTLRPFFQRSSLNCCKKEAIRGEVLIELKDKSKIQFKKITKKFQHRFSTRQQVFIWLNLLYYIILLCLAKVGPQVTIKHQVTIRQLKFHDQLHFNIKKQSNMKFINN